MLETRLPIISGDIIAVGKIPGKIMPALMRAHKDPTIIEPIENISIRTLLLVIEFFPVSRINPIVYQTAPGKIVNASPGFKELQK